MLKRLLLTLPIVLFSLSCSAAEEAAPTFVAGKDYDLISPPIRTSNPDKITVTEFFSYGCGHCFNFEPLIQQWKKGLADDVAFQPSPVAFNPSLEPLSRAYFTAKALNVLDTMHPAIFQAIHIDRKPIQSQQALEALFAANGVSGEDFSKAYTSFGVGSQVTQANAQSRAARISGTPEMMVNGKYRVSTRKAGSQAGMLEVVNFLIEKERAAKAGS